MIGCTVLCGYAVAASAAIVSTEAEVSTTVQELNNGEAASVSLDRGALEPERVGFPLQASSELVSTDLEGMVASFGSAAADLDDPARLDEANPAEFGLEVACFATAEPISYFVRATGIERRTVVFSASSNVDSFPIEFNDDGTRTIESEAFFGGAMIFWSVDRLASFANMKGELSVIVARDLQAQPLFEVGLVLDGDPFGGAAPTVTGSIAFEVGGIELLTPGVGPDTLVALERLDEVASVTVVLVPFQSHTYSYVVREDEEFVLSAGFETLVRNVPQETGAAAALGRDFASLGDLLEDALPEIDGAAVQASINAAMKRPPRDATQQSSGGATASPRTLCGTVGAEFFAVLGIGLLARLGLIRGRGCP
jgi:hypothetical protein